MNIVEKLRKVLRDRVEIYVLHEEIAVESVQLYADEMDERLVPIDVLKNVTEPIDAEMASYRDEIDVDYLLIQLEIGKEAPLEILMIDDEVVGENVTLINENSPKK